MFNGTCDFEAVRDCIAGTKAVDEGVLASIAVLSDRLESLRKSSDLFSEVTFSEEAQDLAACEVVTALC